jgi:hypothetical protein
MPPAKMAPATVSDLAISPKSRPNSTCTRNPSIMCEKGLMVATSWNQPSISSRGKKALEMNMRENNKGKLP